MIILPDRHIARPKVLLFQTPAPRWSRAPSQRKSLYGIEDKTCHFIAAHCDGQEVWRGRFDDQEDFDAFLFAIAVGSLRYERALWELPTPAWHPDFDVDVAYSFSSQTNLTSITGSQQTYTSDATWNNANNTVYVVAGGGGGSGAGGAGAGGGCSTGINFSFATPGTTTAGYELGVVGTQGNWVSGNTCTVGVAGGNSWFNGTAISTSGAVSSIGGGPGLGTSYNSSSAGGSGSTTGAQAQGGGVTKAGGPGGTTSTIGTGKGGSGGGGSGGPNNTGGTGAAGGAGTGGKGGNGDGGSDAGGTGGTQDVVGGAGTEIGGVGFGGGGGGLRNAFGANGGNFGGGGGGGGNSTPSEKFAGAGAQGAIFLVWTPSVPPFAGFNMPMMGI